jgi:hypothetical protein
MRNELLALFNMTGQVGTAWANLRRTSSLAKQADDISKRIVNELEVKATGFGFNDLHLLEYVDSKKMKEIIVSLPVLRSKNVRGKIQEVLTNFDCWFDLGKKAYQEHYERRMKYWSFVLSLIIVVALNANLFDIYREFSTSKALRDIAITMGDKLVSIPRDSIIAGFDTAKIANAQPDSAIALKMYQNVEQITMLVGEQSFQVMGWTKARLDRYEKFSLFGYIVHFLLGWLSTTLLVSLGAPFWYDLLKSLMGIKNFLNSKSSSTSSDKTSV